MSNVIRGLDRIERLILILHCYENLSWTEIAELLELSEMLVVQTYLRILKEQMRCVI